jgi:hypothetical protein
MKIPQKIEKLIEKRANLTEKLNAADIEFAEWLEKNDILDDIHEYDYHGGCEMYVNPQASAMRIKKAIINH